MPATNHIARERVKKYQKRELFSSKYHFRVRPQCVSRLCQYYFSVFRTLFGELWIHHKRYSTIISKITFFVLKDPKISQQTGRTVKTKYIQKPSQYHQFLLKTQNTEYSLGKPTKITHTHTLKREKKSAKTNMSILDYDHFHFLLLLLLCYSFCQTHLSCSSTREACQVNPSLGESITKMYNSKHRQNKTKL